MTDFDDSSEVAVVAGGDDSSSPWVRWIVIGLGAILLSGAGYALASGGGSENAAVVARDDGSSAEETTTEVAASTTNPTAPLATLEPSMSESTTTTGLETVGEGPAPSSCHGRRLPSVVGVRPQDVGPRLGACPDEYFPNPGPSFQVYTVAEPCAPDPSQVGLIASQSPSAGSIFGAPPIRIDVAVYQDCASTVPPTDFVPPSFIGTWPPTTPETSEPTTTEMTGP